MVGCQGAAGVRIGMVLDKTFPPDSRVEREASALIKAGHEVFLFSLNFFSLQKFEDINGIKVLRYPLKKKIFNKLYPLAYTFPLYHLLLKNKLIHFINYTAPDIIHIHDIEIAGLVFQLNKRWNLPVVLDLHENKPEIMKDYSHINDTFVGKLLIDFNKWKTKQNEFISLADKVIVQTPEAKNDIIADIGTEANKIGIVPNTIQLEVFNQYPISQNILNKYQNSFTLVYIGVTAVRRGVDTIIESAYSLKDHISNLKVILVGVSRDDMLLKKNVRSMKMENIVEFTGWQDTNLLRSYIEASDICLSPLKHNIHHDTTYANKLFQYMACGKPQIVSDCSAQANLINELKCGLVHKADDADDLSKQILKLYNDSNLREQLGNNGRLAVQKKYNWENTNQELLKIYSELT